MIRSVAGADPMARTRQRRHKCLCCKSWFVPDPRKRGRQTYCSRKECQRASKAASQQRWLSKSENERYFHGPEHVDRVRRWRGAHPQYWRKKIHRVDTQVFEGTGKSVDVNRPLQDVMGKRPRLLQLHRQDSSDFREGVQRVDQTASVGG